MELLLEQGWGSYCCKRSEERGLVCANQAVAELLWDRPKDQEAKVLNVKIILQTWSLGQFQACYSSIKHQACLTILPQLYLQGVTPGSENR